MNDSTGNEGGIDPRAIIDEHTLKPVSRQRKWQMRMRDLGCCVKCGTPVEMTTRYTRKGFVPWRPDLCPTHRDDNKRRQAIYRNA